LQGTWNVRVAARDGSALRILSVNAALHADTLFTLPGMLSFHTWSGIPPPTNYNTTHWFSLINASKQEEIRHRLEGAQLACVIVNRSIYEQLIESNVATESPLTQWLHANFEPSFAVETYEFWVRKGRRIAAVSMAHLLETASGESPRYKVELVVVSPDLRAINSISLAHLEGDGSRDMVSWHEGNARILITPVGLNGMARGSAKAVNWPFDATSLLRVEILTDEMPAAIQPGSSILYFRDGEGRRLGEARVID
jgi:hypothetical protein